MPGDAVYQNTAAALTVGSVMSEMALAPPITGGHDSVVGGRRIVQVSGGWVGDGITAKSHATAKLVVTGDATSLPVELQRGGTGDGDDDPLRGHHRGEPVGRARARRATRLIDPARRSSRAATTTTQPPTVV